MNHLERLKAAINRQDVDRIPYSMWMHMSWLDMDPRSLAEGQYSYAKKHDFDFIKMMPFGLYSVQGWGPRIDVFCQPNKPPVVSDFAIKDVKEWSELDVLPPYHGAYGNALLTSQHLSKLTKGEIPFVQTLFSPLTSARKLGGDRVFTDLRECPERVHHALEVITETTINFVKANIEAGVSGFFFATQCASQVDINEKQFDEFETKYNQMIFDVFKDKTFLNILHIHGENTYFEKLTLYPANVINWHDRWSSPNMKQARAITKKCLLGGLREIPFLNNKGELTRKDLFTSGTEKEIIKHVYEALDMVDGRGIIIGPGCVCDQLITDDRVGMVRKALENYKRRI